MSQRVTIGWREWLTLPDLGVHEIKAKIDTGARTSSLHAFDIKEYIRGSYTYVSFRIFPIQKKKIQAVRANCLLLEKRWVRNSGGTLTLRPVVLTTVVLGSQIWEIELTLVNRDEMGFRMLLGRQAIRDRFLVHPGKSFLQKRTVEDFSNL